MEAIILEPNWITRVELTDLAICKASLPAQRPRVLPYEGSKTKHDLEELSQRLATLNQLAVLEDALARCRNEDMRTAEVSAALDFLAVHASVKWPFEQFRTALDYPDDEGRWQNLNASLNRIGRALTPSTDNRPEPTRKREWSLSLVRRKVLGMACSRFRLSSPVSAS